MCSYVVTVCTSLVCASGGLSGDAALAPYKGSCLTLSVRVLARAQGMPRRRARVSQIACVFFVLSLRACFLDDVRK